MERHAAPCLRSGAPDDCKEVPLLDLKPREHWEMQTFSRKHGTMAVGRDQRLSPSGGDCRGTRRQVLHEAAGAWGETAGGPA